MAFSLGSIIYPRKVEDLIGKNYFKFLEHNSDPRLSYKSLLYTIQAPFRGFTDYKLKQFIDTLGVAQVLAQYPDLDSARRLSDDEVVCFSMVTTDCMRVLDY